MDVRSLFKISSSPEVLTRALYRYSLTYRYEAETLKDTELSPNGIAKTACRAPPTGDRRQFFLNGLDKVPRVVQASCPSLH